MIIMVGSIVAGIVESSHPIYKLKIESEQLGLAGAFDSLK